jgi:hypothetical protein
MALAYLTLLTGLAISAVAIYYSVIGLAAIFSAAVIPIIVMGTILELSKLVTAWWLKSNWERAPVLLKSYMLVAVFVLMVITSMGIFGFLSKAHTDQNLISGDVVAKVAIYDEKIKTEKDNIEANRKALKQLDEAVDQVMGRSSDEKGAERAVQIRRSQQKERNRLLSDIEQSQKRISVLNEERAPIATEVRKVEAEVGPIKYIAKLIYGDNPDANILEKAVTWVIITIVFVFDPLAVLLLLASQMSFQWSRQEKGERKDELVQSQTPETPQRTSEPEDATSAEPGDREGDGQDQKEQSTESQNKSEVSYQNFNVDALPLDLKLADSVFKDNNIKLILVENGNDNKSSDDTILEDELPTGVDTWNKMIAEAEKAAEREKVLANVVWTDSLQKWRDSNPDADLYEIQRAYDSGEIKSLPWDSVDEEDPKKKN